MKTSSVVQVVVHPHGINQRCRRCKAVLLQSKYAIGLTIKKGGDTEKYLLGAPPQEHCGEQKTFFQLFETEAEANVEKENTVNLLNETGTTEGLRLVAWVNPSNN